MPSIDAIFAEDATWPPYDRSLPWEETRDGLTVVIEPKAHFTDDMMAFDLCARRYCYYRDWRERGKDARFFEHISLCGEDIMMRARATIARELNDGLWGRPG